MAIRSTHYTLDADHNVVPVDDVLTWARAYDASARIVAKTALPGDCEVSTVFLGLDHRFSGHGPPIVFETLVFGGPFDQECERYCTWDEAVAGHARMVEKCQPIMTEDV